MSDIYPDEKPHGPEAFEVGQALGSFVVWAADHADQEERAALSALVEQRFSRDRLQLVRRLCARYPASLRRRLVKAIT